MVPMTERRSSQHVRFSIVLAIAVVLVAALLMAGCNTARGVGQDIESAGERLQRVVE
jgi:predicted small secreted protein